jgi:hypothetical protein
MQRMDFDKELRSGERQPGTYAARCWRNVVEVGARTRGRDLTLRLRLRSLHHPAFLPLLQTLFSESRWRSWLLYQHGMIPHQLP